MGAADRRKSAPLIFGQTFIFFVTMAVCFGRLLRRGSSFTPPDFDTRSWRTVRSCRARRRRQSGIGRIPLLLEAEKQWCSELLTRSQQVAHRQRKLSSTRLYHSFSTLSDAGLANTTDSFEKNNLTKDQNDQDDSNVSSIINPPIERVTILKKSDHYVVVAKPPSVVCHHSDWAGSRRGGKNNAPEIPMLQRVRDALGGRRVNLVHRLDRGASGCLLLTYADENATAILSQAMADKSLCTKTYLALVRGEGLLRGRDFKTEGWFLEERAIKNENGVEKDATTAFRFIAGQHNDAGQNPEKVRASLVLARPVTGRWHQIRKHLNGLSHPILGDSSHGSSRVNREWKAKRGMPSERTCLHLIRLQIAPTAVCPKGVNVSCPLAPDMMQLLTEHLPDVLREAKPVLREEGILLSEG